MSGKDERRMASSRSALKIFSLNVWKVPIDRMGKGEEEGLTLD